MYDFCFTPIYAAFLALAGLLGFLVKGSTASLGGGLGSAAVLSACTYLSLQSYKRGQLCRPATVLSLVISSGLAYMMWQRYSRTGRVMPAVVVGGLSAAMTAFYLWNLLLFKPHFPAAKQQ
ncbi:Protein FATTY ACID EXPORT 5 [Chlorella vulgaris]